MEDNPILGLKNGGVEPTGPPPLQEDKVPDIVPDNDALVEWVEVGEEAEVDNDRVSLGLIGSICTNRTPYSATFISIMKSVWSVKDGVEIVNIGRNVYQIQFFPWRDKKKILDGQPRHFDKFPLLLEEMDMAVKPSDLKIFFLPIWARFYDIPFKGRGNEENARMLGNKIGIYMGMVKSSGYNIEKSLRIRVKIDVWKPLRDSI